MCVAALDVVADGIRSTAATQAAQVCRVHWPGSVISGCSAASHRPALAMMRADDGADLRGQRRGGVPALDPSRPSSGRCPRCRARGCSRGAPADRSGRARRPPAAARTASRRWRPLVAGCARSRANASVVRSSSRGLRLISRAWLSDAGQPVPACAADLAAVAPAHRVSRAASADRVLDGICAEDQPGQVQPVERAQVMEVGEPAEQVGQRDQERADRRLGRQGLGGRGTSCAAGAEQPRPSPTAVHAH